jgi:integrase/recombinase XerD
MTLQEAIESFLFHCRYEKNLSPKTLSAYATDLRQLRDCIGHTLADPSVASAGKDDLRVYMHWLFERYQAKSVKRKVATAKCFWHYLELEDVVRSNPFRKMEVRIKHASRMPRTIPLSEIERLFRFLYRRLRSLGENHGPTYMLLVRDIAVFEALFATGARVSEICNIRLEDLDLAAGWVRILGKGARERVIQLCGEDTLAPMRDYLRMRPVHINQPYFFLNRNGNRLSEQSVRNTLRRRAAAAGVRVAVRPHLVRHSVATLLLEEGVDIRHIQHILGHSSIATTQIYTHIDGRSQRAILTAKHPRRKLPGNDVAGAIRSELPPC